MQTVGSDQLIRIGDGTGDYFSRCATFAMPACAQTSSLSPPTAPLTPTAPIATSPTLIGTPPPTPTVPSTIGIGEPSVEFRAVANANDVGNREANVSAVYALRRLKSMVCGPLPSSRTNAFNKPLPSTTLSLTLKPSARHRSTVP